MIIHEYLKEDGTSPFRDWFERLDSRAAAKVTTSLIRIELGNMSNIESVGKGVYERKIDYGPGYRVYFGMDGGELIILVDGGTKKRQVKDIEIAKDRSSDYKRRKKQHQ